MQLQVGEQILIHRQIVQKLRLVVMELLLLAEETQILHLDLLVLQTQIKV